VLLDLHLLKQVELAYFNFLSYAARNSAKKIMKRVAHAQVGV